MTTVNDIIELLLDRIESQAEELGQLREQVGAAKIETASIRDELAQLSKPVPNDGELMTVDVRFMPEIMRLVRENKMNKIDAIRGVRELTRLSLRESKQLVDGLYAEFFPDPSAVKHHIDALSTSTKM